MSGRAQSDQSQPSAFPACVSNSRRHSLLKIAHARSAAKPCWISRVHLDGCMINESFARCNTADHQVGFVPELMMLLKTTDEYCAQFSCKGKLLCVRWHLRVDSCHSWRRRWLCCQLQYALRVVEEANRKEGCSGVGYTCETCPMS